MFSQNKNCSSHALTKREWNVTLLFRMSSAQENGRGDVGGVTTHVEGEPGALPSICVFCIFFFYLVFCTFGCCTFVFCILCFVLLYFCFVIFIFCICILYFVLLHVFLGSVLFCTLYLYYLFCILYFVFCIFVFLYIPLKERQVVCPAVRGSRMRRELSSEILTWVLPSYLLSKSSLWSLRSSSSWSRSSTRHEKGIVFRDFNVSLTQCHQNI